ncbi:MAG: hypothetical protein L3K17_09240, partial [Thermoplasmata archaeon]|nr:hypothetical protein [Thermoplasmata archaeon]
MTQMQTRQSATHGRSSNPGWRLKAARWTLPIGGGAAALIAALMVAAPLAGASTSITYSSPFSHLVKTVDTGTYSSGCYSYANLPVDPTESPVTGSMVGWDRAATGSCSSSPSNYVSAYSWGDLTLTGFKFTGASTGWANITVVWALNWSARDTVSGGNGTTAWAGSYAALDSWVMDTTTNTYANGSGSLTLWNGGVWSGTMFGHGRGTMYTVSYSAMVTPGDSYTVSAALYTD